jgi:hypothetical protein
MAPLPEDVAAFIAAVQPPQRQVDARIMLDLMARVTGEQPRLLGTIVGFGAYHYRYESGHEGDTCAAGFAPRKAATVVYLVDGIHLHEDALARLGAHRTGVGCLYVTNLGKVDLAVLEEIIAASWSRLTADTFRHRARGERDG